MAIKELDAGQTYSFRPTAVRVQLTGAVLPGGVRLVALDQADHEAETVRLTDTEMVLIPQPRRLRLVAVPSRAASFPAGVSLGLTVRTEGESTAMEQILVSVVDVARLRSHELAVLDFASDRAVLTVSKTRGGIAPGDVSMPDGAVEVVTVRDGLRHTRPDDAEHAWLQAGRWAHRDAEKLGEVASPPASWGVVLDGSASMRRLHLAGELEPLLALACGIHVQWSSAWSAAAAVAGVRVVEADSSATDPGVLTRTAFDGAEPSSWSSVAAATAALLKRMGPDPAVLVVTDGVPGDLDRLTTCFADHPRARFAVLTTGVSSRGLPSDGPIDWWQEELAALAALEAPNVAVVALTLDAARRINLDGSRPAELALSLTRPLPGSVRA